MAVTDPRIFAQSVGLGNLPQLYATNIQAPDISPIQRAQQLSMQEQQFSTSLAMRQQEFKQRERAFELDELEKRLAFDDKLGAKFLSADMPTVYKIMDEIGLSQALEEPLKASEIVPLYKQFHQHERIQALTAKKALTDNLLNYAKENKDVLGRNATAYRDVVLSTASNPNATIQDLAAIDPRAFDYYDYRGLIEDQIAKNKDLSAEEKRQAIKNFVTVDPQARRQLLLDGTVREGDTIDDIVNRLSSIYAVSGKESEEEGSTPSVEFEGAYSLSGESYLSEAARQQASSIISGSGSTQRERLQPVESAKTFVFDNLSGNPDWIEDQAKKVDIERPLGRDSQGFLLFSGTPPSREELAKANKTVERIDGNLYVKVNTDDGAVYYDVGPDSQLVRDDSIVGTMKQRRDKYANESPNEIIGKDFNTHIETVRRFKSELGRNPTLEEIERIFGTDSDVYEMYNSAYESASEAIQRSGTVARPTGPNVPTTAQAMAPQDRSPLTGQPYDPYSNIGTGEFNQPTPLQGTQTIPTAAPTPPPVPQTTSMGTVEGIQQVTGTDLNDITSTEQPTDGVEETIERVVGPPTDLNKVDLGVESISIRANNPINITDKGFAKSHIVGSEAPADGDANITKFDSVEAGLAAFYAKVNNHLNGGGWGSPDMSIKEWQEKFATSPDAWNNFVDSADKIFNVEITEDDTLSSAIEKLGGIENFAEVMSRKENHMLYPKLKEMGLFEKVTQDNYKEYLN